MSLCAAAAIRYKSTLSCLVQVVPLHALQGGNKPCSCSLIGNPSATLLFCIYEITNGLTSETPKGASCVGIRWDRHAIWPAESRWILIGDFGQSPCVLLMFLNSLFFSPHQHVWAPLTTKQSSLSNINITTLISNCGKEKTEKTLL